MRRGAESKGSHRHETAGAGGEKKIGHLRGVLGRTFAPVGTVDGLRWRVFSGVCNHQQKKLIYTRHDKLKMVQRNKLIIVRQNKLI
jgi:hypothetical protein